MKYILYILISLILGYILGNLIVYVFNKMPGVWLVDYNEEVDEEMEEEVRISPLPYKYIFIAFFSCVLIYLCIFEKPVYAIVTAFALFFMLLMAIADYKYMIVPDELIILFTLCAIGYLPFKLRIGREMLFGLLVGFLISITILLLSKVLFKKDGLGGADVKLYSSIGIVTGVKGVILIFLLTTFLSGFSYLFQIAFKKGKMSDEKPLVPYMALATFIYLVFLYKINSFEILL